MITAPEIVCTLLGLPLVGKASDHDGRCATCGKAYQKGDLINCFNPGKSFGDWSALNQPQSSWFCGACKATWGGPFMGINMKTVISQEGAYPFGSNDAIAYWLLNPPEPPFVMAINNAQRAHVLWRAPVSLSKDMILVWHDNRILRIRRPIMLEGLEAYRTIESAIKAEGLKFAPIDTVRDLDASTHGSLPDRSITFRTEHPELEAEYRQLIALSPGEAWGVRLISLAKNIAKPSPMTFKIAANTDSN